jgi:hypothetical protein
MFGRPKVIIYHLVDPIYYETEHRGIEGAIPRGMLASCAANICTALDGKLTLLIEKCREFFLVKTEVERGVPEIQAFWSRRAANLIGTRLDHDEAARELGWTAYGSGWQIGPKHSLLFYP